MPAPAPNRYLLRLLFLIAFVAGLGGCAPRAVPLRAPAPSGGGDEAHLARYVEAVRDDPARLTFVLREMPKGADLHTHLAGAVYAETLLALAVRDSLCLDLQHLSLFVPAPDCGAATAAVPAHAVAADEVLRNRVVDAWSMRNWHPSQQSGHDRFFGTFDRFGAASVHMGEMVAEVAERAAANHAEYLELMVSPYIGPIMALGASAGYDADLERMRGRLLDAGLRDAVAAARSELHEGHERARALLGCGGGEARPGCDVTVRYLFQVLRAQPPERVFAQILAGYETASQDSLVVGLNLVQPEDHATAMRDYALHMRMLRFLNERYPGVALTLHAGELTQGLVPPEGLRDHIRQAVEVASARRIGHGVDVAYEDDAYGLLREMAARRVMVEVNLTSNAAILGVRGKAHPLSLYLEHGVPVALSTDDEGVLRTDLTAEYVRAVQDQGLGYRALKALARNALHYAFVEGSSLWDDVATLRPVDACAPGAGGFTSASCRQFLATNLKARLQWEHEQAVTAFERSWRSARVEDAATGRAP